MYGPPRFKHTLIGVLMLILAAIAGWRPWAVRETSPLLQQSEVHQVSEPHEFRDVVSLAHSPGSRAQSSGSDEAVVPEGAAERAIEETTTEETTVELATQPDSKWDTDGDLPSYLNFAIEVGSDPAPPNQCKHPFELLHQMRKELRDEIWAPRMKRDLRAILGQHPLGFPVSIGCRATICQITSIGPVAAYVDRESDVRAYWGTFIQNLRNTRSASEFSSRIFFTAEHHDDPTQDVSGYVLTRVGDATPSEPPHCVGR